MSCSSTLHDKEGLPSSLIETTARGGKGLAVFIQDQTTSLIDVKFLNRKSIFQLSANTTINTRFFTVLTGHTIIPGDTIELFSATNFIQTVVLSVVTNTIEIDTLIGDIYETGINFNVSTSDLRVDGSVTPVIFTIKPELNQIGDMNLMKFGIQSAGAMDFSLFGSAAPLTNGIVLRYKRSDGTFENAFNFKSNGDLVLRGFNHYIKEKVGGGLHSFICKIGFNGQQDNGVTIRLDGNLGEELQLVVQDNLSAIGQSSMVALAEGSNVQG